MNVNPTDTETRGPAGYPAPWEFDGLLSDGEAVLVRPVRPADAAALVELHVHLARGAGTRAVEHLHPAKVLEELAHFTTVDYVARMAFVAVVESKLVALASYDRIDSDSQGASINIVVADSFQRRGVATLLFESLAAYARTKGFERFLAEVGAPDSNVMGVLAATGLRMTSDDRQPSTSLEVALQPTPQYRVACDEREAIAEAASAASILHPNTIAVVGAGRRRGGVGHEVVRSLLSGDFAGAVYPVNPSARAVCGVRAFASLSAVPEPIDLAIVAVPAAAVPAVIQEAALRGVRAVTVITAGFAETGRSGADVESELLRVARRHGMRIVGPNCLGLINTDPEVRMNATFASLDPRPGRLALVSQSGAVGIVLAEQASAAGLGLSSFVSVGNKLDVSSNDLLCFFERDERTSVIALYLESIGNPRKFARIARRVGEHKPIVALKAGRTTAGARGARSHTAAAATPEVTVTALLKGAGIIKVDRLEELLDVSAVLLAGRLPRGRRVALVGNSGGPLILAADACEAGGLEVPELDPSTKDQLRQVLVDAAALANPVDLTADGSGESLAAALTIVLDDPAIDAAVVVVTELVSMSGAEARAAIARVAQRSDKPVVACVLGAAPSAGVGDAVVAEVPSPERAAAALDHVCRYAAWRKHLHDAPERPLQLRDNATVREIVASAFAQSPEGGWLELEEAARLLEACGVPVLATRSAASADEAVDVARSLGFPVVLKARAGSLVHKSDVGGVMINLADEAAVRAAFLEMSERLGEQMGGAVLQPMAPSGVEAIVGLAADPEFGPVVMVGLGGVLTDLLGDHAFATPPLDAGVADAMVASLHAAPLLDGYRGAAKVDRAALVSVLELVARAAEQVPELVELDLNPVLVTSDGALVLDCKARLSPCHPGPGPLFRSFRPSGR
jgi:acyl-CoA synthetase (NDP forming)/GNAT superfamily N-acetyltransferase